jgi:hypothetical protein
MIQVRIRIRLILEVFPKSFQKNPRINNLMINQVQAAKICRKIKIKKMKKTLFNT